MLIIEKLNLFQGVDPVNIVLAYAGMVIYSLLKMADLSQNDKFSIKEFAKKNVYTIVATFIMIPITLILLTGSDFKDILPINKVTSVLVGYQTQSFFKSLMGIVGGKVRNSNYRNSDDSNML